MGDIGGARWQDDDQLHLTTRFIGDVDRRMAEDIAIAMAHVQPTAVRVSLCGVGRFEKQGRTDTIWAGIAPHAPAITLHKKVDRVLVALGLPAEGRAHLPHITLARLPRSLGVEAAIDHYLACRSGLASAPFAFTHITLFQSHLSQDGARYEAIDRWPIAT